MRPERLSLSAFGPFAAEQVFDFADLRGQRLFLIHGPTGAGKTTLLDALCFALFGESSGRERAPAQLRSQHAAAGTPTWVELDFALGPEHYRLRRSPAQERPGRGGKPVIVPPRVALWRRDGEASTVLAEQTGRVREEIERLLGYSDEEFRQVVVLPQGRFREVLTAAPGVRQEILATLFRTSLYRRVQERVAASARLAQDEARRIEAQRAILLAQASASTEAEASASAAALREQAREAEASASRLRLQADLANARLVEGQQADRAIATARLAETKLLALRARAGMVDTDRARLAAARRAAGTLAADLLYVQSNGQADREREAAASARQRLADATARFDRAAENLGDEPARRDAIAVARADAERLAGQARAGKAAEAAEGRAAVAARDLEAAETACVAAEAAFIEALAAHEKAVTARAEAARMAEAADLRRAVLARARDLSDDFAAAAALASELEGWGARKADADLAVDDAARRLDVAIAARAAAEAALRDHHAAYLAEGLTSGAPCPVCGGTDHPMPHAADGGDLPDVALVVAGEQSARTVHATAQDAARRADDRLARTVEQVRALRERLPPNVDPAQLAEDLRQASLAAREADLAAARLPALSLSIDEAARLRDAAAKMATDAAAAVRDVRQALDIEQGAIAALRVEAPLAAGRGAALSRAATAAATEAAALAARLDAELAERAGAAAGVEAATRHAEQAAARDAEAAAAAGLALAEWEASCAAAGFDDPAAARAARLDEGAPASLDAAIAGFDRDLAQADALAVQAREAAAGLAPPDLADLAAHEAAARQAALDAEATAARLGERHRQAAALLSDIGEIATMLNVARAREEMRRDLAETIAGKNDRKLSLEGFVLASVLDEALAAANHHLSRMLGGRYRIQRRDEPFRGTAAVGLDIEVCDDWTGQLRSAGTLSGGEGFCAALALALGLADTVQAHAGARRIDALFIDEGFGSLDEDALDTAMDVLTSLQAGDRLVGIISHVAELRGRIPAQLMVQPGPRGSSARFVAPVG